MHPLTLDVPKPLLPVGAHPLVEHQVAAVTALGVERVVLSTGYRHADFEPLVAALRSRGVDLATATEDVPLGTGGGLREALRGLGDADTIVVLNGDLLTGHDLARQVAGLERAPEDVIADLHVREVRDPWRYGSVVVGGDGHVTGFAEKSPSPPSPLVNAGTYVIRPGLLDHLPPAGALSLERQVFPRIAEAGGMVAHREEAYFLDVGTPSALVGANRDLLQGRFTSALPVDRGPALVLPGARVDPSARLEDGSVVHPHAEVGPGVVLSAALVLPGARVRRGARVARSVLGPGVDVGVRCDLLDCAVAAGEVVADGEHLEGISLPPV